MPLLDLEKELKITTLHIDALEKTLAEYGSPKDKAELYAELAKRNSRRAELEMRISVESGDEDPDLPSSAVVETGMKVEAESDSVPPMYFNKNSNFAADDEGLDLPGDEFDLPASS